MQPGDFVRIDYVGRLESGEVFDLTREEAAKAEKIFNPSIRYKPVPVVIGAGFLIPGLDKALLGMSVGERKSVQIAPDEGFGQRDPKLVRIVPRKAFGDKEPKPGLIVDFSGLKGRVQSISAGRVMVDFNNPLAGKALNYEIEVNEKIEGMENKVKAILEFFGIGKARVVAGETVEIETPPLPVEMKERISSLVMKHITEKKIDSVRFVDVYERKEASAGDGAGAPAIS